MTHSSSTFHLMIWIDHKVAQLFGVTREGLVPLGVINAPDQGLGHVHHKAGIPGPGHVAVSAEFLREVTQAIGTAQEILIVGPSDTKHALKDHLMRHAPELAHRVIGVEPMDKCGTQQLQDFAHRLFHQFDRMNRPPA